MERLDKHFKAIARGAFERHGFAHGEILNQWPSIAGEKLARWATPLRVVWPRQLPTSHKSGGTLVIRIEPALALDLQYEAPRLIERVNCYFGYAAIAAIRIVPGEAAGTDRQRSRAGPCENPEQRQMLHAQLAGIADERLQDALSRLGSGIHRQRRKPPQS